MVQHVSIEEAFLQGFRELAKQAHANAREKGFWEKRSDAEAIALIHSEVSEALEGIRDASPSLNGGIPTYPKSPKIEGFNIVEEEFADTVIRIMDFAGGRGLDVAGAMLAKMAHNRGRPHMHGRQF